MLRFCGAKRCTSLRARLNRCRTPKAGPGGSKRRGVSSTYPRVATVQIGTRTYCRELQWSTAQNKPGRRLAAWQQSPMLVVPHSRSVPSQQSMMYLLANRNRVRRHPKQAWAAVGGVAAMLLILVVLVLKLEFRSGHGGLTASPRSACTYSGICAIFLSSAYKSRRVYLKGLRRPDLVAPLSLVQGMATEMPDSNGRPSGFLLSHKLGCASGSTGRCTQSWPIPSSYLLLRILGCPAAGQLALTPDMSSISMYVE